MTLLVTRRYGLDPLFVFFQDENDPRPATGAVAVRRFPIICILVYYAVEFCFALRRRRRRRHGSPWLRGRASHDMHEYSRAARFAGFGSQVRLTRLDSAERAGHVLRTLPLAKLVSLRPTIRKSGVFELSVSSSPILSFCLRSDGYHFVLFTLFCDFDTLEVYGLFSIRPPVYGEYILTCWISICLYLSVYAQEWQSTNWLMRQRRDRAMNCITEYNIEGRTLPCRPIDFYDTQNPM